ncbi:MAG: hypothetical protein JF887_03610 [Candidatus Dormibacteraeota bacterium]|uniref:Uncharacterized protein n=1 Tax=Candidatus Amunia macphersoniae TaxID=3127014 RepID=A0A934KMG8_9BACT|nr:hypothetical protein [Candidatus Dormibacteraeota bacterium]
MKVAPGRASSLVHRGWRRLVTMPRAARLALIGLVVAGGFVGVVLPLFSNGGAPRAEIAGSLPESARAGSQVRIDIAVDNVGDSIIYPVCVALSGDGATLLSANFQGLDQVAASANRVCGGQLTGQETISITLVFTLNHRGNTDVRLVPQQGATVIGPLFRGTVAVS